MALWFWRRLLNFVNVFLLFQNNLSLEKGCALQLNKQSPSPKNAMCWVWLKLAKRFWRGNVFIFVNVFLLFLLSSLGKVWASSFEQTWIPFTQGCIVSNLVEIVLIVNHNDNNDNDNNDFQRPQFDQKISLAWAFCSNEQKNTCKHSLGTLILDKQYKNYRPKI